MLHNNIKKKLQRKMKTYYCKTKKKKKGKRKANPIHIKALKKEKDQYFPEKLKL